MNDWLSEYEPILRPYLPLLPAESSLKPEDRLADLGLDSMGTVGLLLELEDAFAVTMPDDMLTASTFDSPAALKEVIEGLRVLDAD